MNPEIAISVSHVSKTFKIPHEKISSLRGAFVSAFKKNTYEKFQALDDVSFEVKKGEFFGIIGRNGSGKSTLLKILAGIYEPDKGSIKIDGLISPFLELGIGFNPELSGRDNIYLNATVLGMTKKQIDQKFKAIVAFSELERFIDQKLKNYSSGMSVRLAFSVAIHANRDILLMDEVLAVGDSNFQSKCLEEFNKYKDAGKTVILVTHDIATIQRYCDRAMLLRGGKIAKIGKAEEVGNEYIYQNMSDEEKRIVDAQKAENKKNIIPTNENIVPIRQLADEEATFKPQKIAEITKIEFLNKNGEIKNVFKTGDDISIRAYFKIYKKKPIFNFGVSIYTKEKIYIFGTNTIFDNIETKSILQKGYFQINLKTAMFGMNSYYTRIVVAGNNFLVCYSEVFQSELFKVYSDKKSEGNIYMEHSWEDRE